MRAGSTAAEQAQVPPLSRTTAELVGWIWLLRLCPGLPLCGLSVLTLSVHAPALHLLVQLLERVS